MHTASEILSSQWSDQPHQRTQCMHRRHKNMDEGKSAQTKRRQNRSSSLSLFVFLETFYRFPPWFDYSWLSRTTSPSLILPGTLNSIFDSKLSTKKQVIKICQTAYFELKRISSVHSFLSEDAAKTLVTSYIISRLDYCNCLLMVTNNSVIQPLQKIQNFAARLVLLAGAKRTSLAAKFCHHHSTPLLEKLHWLRISERCLYVFQCYKWFWSCLLLWTAACLHSVPYTTFSWHPHTGNPTIQTQDSWLSHLLLLWTPHLEFTPTRP